MGTDERCEFSGLLKIHCAHCLGHKDADEEELDELGAMVRNLQRFNKAGATE